MKNFLSALYFSRNFWVVLIVLVVGYVWAYIFPVLWPLMNIALILGLVFTAADIYILFRIRQGIFARRHVPERLSNGDDNPVTIFLENNYAFKINIEVVDEIPHQFQRRDVLFLTKMAPGAQQQIHYELRPVQRGTYDFGKINVFVSSPLRLLMRRYRFDQHQVVPVYPSFLQMRQFSLLAVANRLNEVGVKRIRQVGQSMEFDQVRGYVFGDDPRAVNWKATARQGDVMVNSYQDSRQQPVYCLIDKGRVMQSPFDGLTLLDYAINAALVLSNIALMKDDKAGLITFADKIGQTVPADRRSGQLQKLLEVLYHQKTIFPETDFERLASTVRYHIRQRSLLLLFTNFETLEALQRQLPYLRRMARNHMLVVIFFENTETKELVSQPAANVEALYLKTIAGRFQYEKKRILAELRTYGIQAIYTPPQQLSVNTINKYLELKARGVI
ncbi:hypothetical protein DYBT9275_04014 [Dyadobacter sp. CECT 9275]|uniref:DUF58 domain-containing protein n=1 Tax=Dyadobacter helix TaxID=2822344 RepID=A0A916JFP9_9BACT|nr:DUF58 domain-containing protein [Dyadobacter sp. CECT 9275]CAG5007291.1 hypothetical protein DYBT9275_04014 [Dyadobacter sp. CECT 9275]